MEKKKKKKMAVSAARGAGVNDCSLDEKSEAQPRYDQKTCHLSHDMCVSDAESVAYYDSLRLPKEKIVLFTVTLPEVPSIPSSTC